jgi:hypothetical protein
MNNLSYNDIDMAVSLLLGFTTYAIGFSLLMALAMGVQCVYRIIQNRKR